ncbi:MAG: LytTR family DNA-binding domain-containing protein [Chitinophagaceae bacterium]|nr:LytTR family DNA-binding domain-containing protein [Chitinophagaceae bacterium]
MKLKAVAIDDEPLALEIVKQYCTQHDDIDLLQTFDNAVAGLEYMNQQLPDLLFIDVDMPDMNGIALVNSMKSRPMIIFTTAYKEFALEGFELEAVDYLLKPFSFGRFERAVQKAFSYYKIQNSASKTAHIFVYSEYRMVKIELDSMVYIESLDDYIKIHLSDGNFVMTLMSLKKIAEDLPADQFMRIHRSYIASAKYISALSGRKIILANGVLLPVSETYAAQLARWVKHR